MNDLAVDLAFAGLLLAAFYIVAIVIRDWKGPNP